MSANSPSVRSSLVFSFAERYGSLVITLLSTLVLSRILTPEEIGIYSVSIAAVGLAQTLRDFGISNFLIQAKNINDDIVRTALTLSAILSAILCLALLLSGPMLAEYYQQPGIQSVIKIVSINMLLIPLGSTLYALLRRELRFETIAKFNLLGALMGAMVSIGSAMLGAGFMSLAYGAVASVLVTTLGVAVKTGRKSLYKPSFTGWRELLHFGGYASTAAISGELNARIPDFTLAKSIGFNSVGIYGKAYSAVYLVTNTIFDSVGSVFLPSVAKALRAGEDAGALFHRALAYMTAIILPIYAMIYFLSGPMIHVLFGSQWSDAVPVASALAIAAGVYALGFGLEHVLIASGRIRRLLLLRVAMVIPTLAVFLTMPEHGLGLTALATAPLALIYLSVAYYLTSDAIHLNLRKLLRIGLHSSFVATLTSIPSAALGPLWDGSLISALVVLLFSGLLGGIAWITGLRVAKHALLNELSRVLTKARVPASWQSLLLGHLPP
ncbi:MAG TPA: oligosaccharide flippase family protein [Thiobacillaceae bacterium]|nr:oligosaccharide flippase family protein [Thiobacillaceae bacterium]